MILQSTLHKDLKSISEGEYIFLGPWCLDKVPLIEPNSLKYSEDRILPPFGHSFSEQLQIDYLYEKYYYECFDLFIGALNNVHCEKFSKRFWEISIGSWYNRFFSLILNRYLHLKKSIHKNSNISEHRGVKIDLDYIVSDDEKLSVNMIKDQKWNAIVYTILVENFFDLDQTLEDFSENIETKLTRGKSFLKSLFVNKQISFLNSSIFIYKPYISPFRNVLLQLRLGQIPVLWDDKEILLSHKTNHKIRKLLQKKMLVDNDDLLSVLCYMLPLLIPRIFLEDFKITMESLDQIGFPTNVKVIYTANGFAGDSLFQLWAANKVLSGTRYVVGQHGNNYGTLKLSTFWPEMNTSDKFISWGWRDPENKYVSKIIPLGKFTNQYSNKSNLDRILIIMKGHGNRSSLSCRSFEYFLELNTVLKLSKKLLENTNLTLTIRMHNNSDFREMNFLDLSLKKYKDKIKIENTNKKLSKSIYENDLVIFSYDSTGFLECLQSKIPVMSIYPNSSIRLFPKTLKYYDNMKKLDLIHYSYISMTKLIKDLAENKDAWLLWKIKIKDHIDIKEFNKEFNEFCISPEKEIADLLIAEKKLFDEYR